jgi:hypothetical protein
MLLYMDMAARGPDEAFAATVEADEYGTGGYG